MTHDEFEALPTAEKLAVREKDLKEARERLTDISGKLAYSRMVYEDLTAEFDTVAEGGAKIVRDVRRLTEQLEAEKAAARAAKRKKFDTAPEPQPATENPNDRP